MDYDCSGHHFEPLSRPGEILLMIPKNARSQRGRGPIMRPLRRLGISLLLALSFACSSVAPPRLPSERPTDAAEPVRTIKIQRADISGVVTLAGEIRPRSRQTLNARVSGVLNKVLVDLG